MYLFEKKYFFVNNLKFDNLKILYLVAKNCGKKNFPNKIFFEKIEHLLKLVFESENSDYVLQSSHVKM